jgi:hypothetical protein
MTERLYSGELPNRVLVREGGEKRPLDPRLDLRRHSSSGFAWGKGNDNAAPAHQLALALVADALRNDQRAAQLHERFSRRVVTLFPHRWTITRSRVLAYIDRIEEEAQISTDLPRVEDRE